MAKTLLRRAINDNDLEAIKYALDVEKQKINHVYENSYTLIMYAAKMKTNRVFKYLLNYPNIDLTHKNKFGDTVFDMVQYDAQKSGLLFNKTNNERN